MGILQTNGLRQSAAIISYSLKKNESITVKLENLTRSGRMVVPGSGVWWTNGLDGSDGSDFTV